MLHPPYLILILHLSSRDTFTNLMRDIIIISLPSGYSLGNKKYYIFEMFDWLCTQKGFFSSWNCIILQSWKQIGKVQCRYPLLCGGVQDYSVPLKFCWDFSATSQCSHGRRSTETALTLCVEHLSQFITSSWTGPNTKWKLWMCALYAPKI